MPIYAYRCASCGHAQDVLQKLSDPVLTVCPACGAPTYQKQLTAAGFQLKGSGWYVTDFRGGNNAGAKAESGDKKPDGADVSKASGDKPATPADAKPAEAAKPAAESSSAAKPAAADAGAKPSST